MNGSSASERQVRGNNNEDKELDLVGGPFAVIESDPGVFTSLIRKLGIRGVEVEEVYDVQYSLQELCPKGLILCFKWKHDKHHPRDFRDPAAQNVWFANQLSDDACSSLAILNVLFNCPDVDLGQELSLFKQETSEMSSVMKGLAVSNLRKLRAVQNSLARPADIWGSLSAIAEVTKDEHKTAYRAPSRKKAKLKGDDRRKSSKAKSFSDEDYQETYHFIGYVPAYGKVWELDGLKSGPLEVGELPSSESTRGWEDVVRPALRLKMEKYGAASNGEDHDGSIHFNLLALVQDRYETKSDQLELLKRKAVAIEKRLGGDAELGRTAFRAPYAADFAARRLEMDVSILQIPESELVTEVEQCVTETERAQREIDDEMTKAMHSRVDSVKRTHDYNPFIRGFLTALHEAGLVQELLNQS